MTYRGLHLVGLVEALPSVSVAVNVQTLLRLSSPVEEASRAVMLKRVVPLKLYVSAVVRDAVKSKAERPLG